MKKLIAVVLFSLAVTSSARADESRWRLDVRRKGLSCELTAPIVIRKGADSVESRKLVCTEKKRFSLVHASMVSCGPEGNRVTFGRGNRRVTVRCLHEAASSVAAR